MISSTQLEMMQPGEMHNIALEKVASLKLSEMSKNILNLTEMYLNR